MPEGARLRNLRDSRHPQLPDALHETQETDLTHEHACLLQFPGLLQLLARFPTERRDVKVLKRR